MSCSWSLLSVDVSLFFPLLLGLADAFVSPQAFVATLGNSNKRSSLLQDQSPYIFRHKEPSLKLLPSFILGDEALDATQSSFDGVSAALSGLRTFFIAITAVAFALAGLTYFTAAFIVPKAAQQLEQDTKRLKPGLWEEYEAKLNEGETMATRPDLLQELGNIMQPIILGEYDENAKKKEDQTDRLTSPSSVIDATVVTEEGDSSATKDTNK